VNANTVIAICGVIIAVASLGLSAYVAWATRNHNRLSVRPLLGLPKEPADAGRLARP
jgi:hypothetical protein